MIELVLGAARAIWPLFSYAIERPRISLSARYIREVHVLIIEVTNPGRKPITVTGAGISGIPEGLYNRDTSLIWHVEEKLPARIDDGDCIYLSVGWGNKVPRREKASYAWVRDTTGRTYTSQLKASQGFAGGDDPIEKADLSDMEKARLFNLETQREYILETKKRLAHIEAEVEWFRTRARIEREKKVKKS